MVLGLLVVVGTAEGVLVAAEEATAADVGAAVEDGVDDMVLDTGT